MTPLDRLNLAGRQISEHILKEFPLNKGGLRGLLLTCFVQLIIIPNIA